MSSIANDGDAPSPADACDSDTVPGGADNTATAPPPTQSETPASASVDSAPAQTPSLAPAPGANSIPLSTSFINNTVTGVNGQSVMVSQRPRKKRKDAGVPRKKRAVANQNDRPAAVPAA
ncbi:hypothetical protein K435DRAFT_865657 [Dendrothele bispora CBS 962.96]|uniref:Uncharacterized protein n=1 Tax=Dendrothele bispora (strain CBS 962.96) TaxID=1314807 RepID=A0A4S8LK98_DENBC|nr:hypothetical protein K435DRAFT_865657 [Dendrothele bispora CBS 962.96]